MASISDPSSAGAINEAVDVAILTVIPAELFAALDALGISSESARERSADGTVYYRGAIRSELRHRDYRLVVTCIGGAGNPGAAAATRDVISAYRPRAVLLMGIAAGIRGKVRIGNVVLSERVVAYEPAALIRTADGKSIEQPRPEIDRAPHAIQQDVTNYRFNAERAGAIFLHAGGVYLQPVEGEPEDKVKTFREHVAQAITVRVGTVASGEKLLRDPSKLLDLRDNMHGKTEVGEMEAAGVVEACRRGQVPWLVVRGISDFGDELKDDRFHDLASHAAAAVVADFLAHGLDLVAPASPGSGGGKAFGLAALGLLVVIGGVGIHSCIPPRPSDNGPAAVESAVAVQQAPSAATVTSAPTGVAVGSAPSFAAPSSAHNQAKAVASASSAVAVKAATGSSGTSAKGEAKDIAAGDQAKINIGVAKGSGSAEGKAGNVNCGNDCEVNVGVVTSGK